MTGHGTVHRALVDPRYAIAPGDPRTEELRGGKIDGREVHHSYRVVSELVPVALRVLNSREPPFQVVEIFGAVDVRERKRAIPILGKLRENASGGSDVSPTALHE